MAPADPTARTVLPPRGGGRKIDPALYDRAARPVFEMAEQLAVVRGVDALLLLKRAAEALERFDAELLRGGALPSTVPPARYALGLILDQKARSNRGVEVGTWAAGAHRMLFDGRDMSLAMLRDFIRKAEAAGADFDAVRGFLNQCLSRAEGERTRYQGRQSSGWGGMVAVLVAGFVLAVLGWVGFVEWRFHRDLNALFAAEALEIGLDRTGVLPDLAPRLDRLAEAARRVDVSAAKAPVNLFAGLLGFDASRQADLAYRAAVQTHLPGALARAIDAALAREGEGLASYDTLRAWSVLSGQGDWSPAYLTGWLVDRAQLLPDAQRLAPHVAVLTLPAEGLPQPDPELLEQARGFAAETAEADRAYQELIRSDAAAALPDWRADQAVPGLSDVLLRKSGTAMSVPIPGIFTRAGWDMAREVGAGVAVRTTRAEAARLFVDPPAIRNDSPDQVMGILQTAQLARWKAYLGDLRVRPFSDAEQSVLVSGRLSVANSPLEALLREVWAQAGGLDRLRPHEQQIRVATEFAAMIQYVEQGRMADISSLFAALNVALGAMDKDEPRGLQRLMSVQERNSSVSALRQAPLVVVQIVEDVLVQSSASQSDGLTNKLTKDWQRDVLSMCRATEGRFPFADGPDAEIDAFARLLAPDGAIDRFFRTRAEQFIDTSASPWRWKPDARFAGLNPDSAAFFQRARAITSGFFAAPQAGMTLSALAERGKAFVLLGGAGGPVETSVAPQRVAWPGPDAGAGMDVRFATPEGEARISQPGVWGLFRVLGGLRLRERDGGKRFLVDVRAGGARLFVEIAFDLADNPLARWPLVKGFACPTAL